ncbi:MAG TPA: hypothetical protein VI548_09185 [Chitinophagaceae bacterium]|nr:hypothetical protein [Chitinophagaceae bacterium]
MKKINRKFFMATCFLLATSVALFSFNIPWGGDSFTIHLNDKLIVKQYLYGDKTIKSIELNQRNYNDELRISYSHCGTTGKDRTLAIKDQKGKVLKQWNFSDNNATMTCKVKDILGLEKENTALRIFYSSAEMPRGHVLASIVTDNRSTAKK